MLTCFWRAQAALSNGPNGNAQQYTISKRQCGKARKRGERQIWVVFPQLKAALAPECAVRWPNMRGIFRRAQAALSNAPNGNAQQYTASKRQRVKGETKGENCAFFNASCCPARAPLPVIVQKLGTAVGMQCDRQLCF